MNKVILVGNLARDPELRTTASGVSVCNFSIAVNRRYTNQQGVREADFISCVAWRTTADFITKFFSKGKKIGVVGSIQTRSYEGNDGQKRYVTEVIVDEAEFVERNPNAAPFSGDPRTPQDMPMDNGDMGFTQVDDDELPF